MPLATLLNIQASTTKAANPEPIEIGIPVAEDGAAVNELIAACKPLDENSLYCNLLQCDHFAETSAIAKMGDDVVGFVSGYRLPSDPDTLFVWQVAVSPKARGRLLAKHLILEILSRPICEEVTMLHTTITAGNAASQAVFESVARTLKTEAGIEPQFDRDRHLAGEHASEYLWAIGPFESPAHEALRRKAA